MSLEGGYTMFTFFLATFACVAVLGLFAGFVLLALQGAFKVTQAGYNKVTGNTASKRDIKKLYGHSLEYIQKHPDEDYGYR